MARMTSANKTFAWLRLPNGRFAFRFLAQVIVGPGQVVPVVLDEIELSLEEEEALRKDMGGLTIARELPKLEAVH